tara:strand:+ start:782 stop:1285 length:504 start_codon:yes stop_codon:yes gene_type:complete
MSGTGSSLRSVERSVARLQAVQALYQIEMISGDVESVIKQMIHHGLGRAVEGGELSEADSSLFDDIVRGLYSRQTEIDDHLAGAMNQRDLSRLDIVVRAIVRAGTYELLARVDIPARVVINEYVDLAHAFFGGGEAKFVNGVLDRIARTLRSLEVDKTKDGETKAKR